MKSCVILHTIHVTCQMFMLNLGGRGTIFCFMRKDREDFCCDVINYMSHLHVKMSGTHLDPQRHVKQLVSCLAQDNHLWAKMARDLFQNQHHHHPFL